MDGRATGLMNPTVILINTARGPIVETEALHGALKAERSNRAGPDVCETEPVPATMRCHWICSSSKAGTCW